MGVGHLIIIDGDRFEENNLNRQLGCTEATLGTLKAEFFARRVSLCNRPSMPWPPSARSRQQISGRFGRLSCSSGGIGRDAVHLSVWRAVGAEPRWRE